MSDRDPNIIRVDAQRRRLSLGQHVFSCRIGRDGFVPEAQGREGDAKTPLGTYRLRFGLYRADRLPMPRSGLTFWPMRPDDGWCDDPQSAAYNRFIKLPNRDSHETLWRADAAYDLIVVMSHNDSPPRKGFGSAVFLHVAQTDDRATLGCIALSADDWARLLPKLFTAQRIDVFA